MSWKQYTLIFVALASLFLLWQVNNIPPQAKHAGGQHQHQTITDDNVQTSAIAALDSANAIKVKELIALKTPKGYADASSILAKNKQGNAAAFYIGEAAKLENTEKSLTFAAQTFIDLFNMDEDTTTNVWRANKALKLAEIVLAKNANNQDAKVIKGLCLTDGLGKTMDGVFLLREVATSNPGNIQAGVALGRLAIQSGQWDKAITRLADLDKLHPKNVQILGFLADAYKGSGNIAKAKELLNQCKQIIGSPEYSKGIDEYIKTF